MARDALRIFSLALVAAGAASAVLVGGRSVQRLDGASRLGRSVERRLVPVGMVDIPEAMVEIGEPPADLASGPTQEPQPVAAFYIDQVEVSNADWLAFVDACFPSATARPADRLEACPAWWGGTTYPRGLGDHPVRGVCYERAEAYARWLGKRLPTEVEWEYAARGPSYWQDPSRTVKHDFPWGSLQTDPSLRPYLARYKAPAEGPPTAPVRSYESGRSVPFGLYNMAGNVAEWTSSPYVPYRRPRSYARDADFGPRSHTVRGGSYRYGVISAVRCAVRDGYPPGAAPDDVGFRCAKSVPLR
ncbi:MAG TPA: SUMF1/EgtB/PvdO family nonheme iron enzyme [Planctomycetota bacterium]|nr:SUMF1/EgtB/PvdO family nonheme iron enzyme [Planctomycetota bacterium]